MNRFKLLAFLLPIIIFSFISFLGHNYIVQRLGITVKNDFKILEKPYFFDDADFQVYFTRSNWLPEKKIPYLDVMEEYPQWAVLYISLPRFFTSDYLVYRNFLVLMNGFCYFLVTFFLYLILKKSNKINRLFFLFLPSFLFFTFNRFDILVALLSIASYYFLINKKDGLAFLLIGFAVLTKWFAFLFLPIYLLYLFHEKRVNLKKSILLLIIFGLPIILPLAVTFLFAGFAGLAQPYILHFFRAIDIYSTLSFFPASQPLLGFYFYLELAGMVLPFIWVKVTNQKVLLLYLTLSVLLFVFFGRVYSPQFIIWFFPFLLLALNPNELWLLVIYDILNYISYNWTYLAGGDELWRFGISLHFCRIIIFVIIIYLVFLKIHHYQKKPKYA